MDQTVSVEYHREMMDRSKLYFYASDAFKIVQVDITSTSTLQEIVIASLTITKIQQMIQDSTRYRHHPWFHKEYFHLESSPATDTAVHHLPTQKNQHHSQPSNTTIRKPDNQGRKEEGGWEDRKESLYSGEIFQGKREARLNVRIV